MRESSNDQTYQNSCTKLTEGKTSLELHRGRFLIFFYF